MGLVESALQGALHRVVLHYWGCGEHLLGQVGCQAVKYAAADLLVRSVSTLIKVGKVGNKW